MDAAPFETLLRVLATAPSRRHVLRLLAGSALGGSLTLSAVPTQAKKKPKVTFCHAGQTIRVRTKATKKHLRHGDTRGACPPPPVPAAPVPVVTYQCPGPKENAYVTCSPATERFAQTFTAAESGSLQQIQFEVNKAPGSTGDYLVELLDFDTNGPTNTVLAQFTIPNASVPDGDATLTGSFSGPLLTAGAEYTAAVSRPGGNQITTNARSGNDCTGRSFRQNPRGSGPFTEGDAARDWITAVTVLAYPGDPDG